MGNYLYRSQASGSVSPPGPAVITPVQIRAHEKIAFGSDSLTTGFNGGLSWPTGTGNFLDQVNALLGAGNEVIDFRHGQPGTGVVYLLAHLQTLILQYNPSCVILNVGTNDPISPLGVPGFKDIYIEILRQIKTAIPNVKIICIGLGPLTREQWTTLTNGAAYLTPAVDPNSNAAMYTYDQWIAEACGIMRVPFVNWRQAYTLFDVANNPTGLTNSGIATVDGTHYNDAGQKALATAVLQPSICTVSP